MDYDVNKIVAKYIELRDARDTEAKAFAESAKAKYGDPMETIEKWLLQFMEQNGLDNVKTSAGTPYKAINKSVKMADPEAFKRFVFKPLIDVLANLIQSQGGQVPDLYALLQSGAFWDMVDFRVGKKGVVSYAEENGTLPPGVTLDQFVTINIRRS